MAARRRGRRLQQKAHHIEARRPHHRPGVQAKAGVLRALRGRAPQPRDVVDGPAFGLQFLERNARHRQHRPRARPWRSAAASTVLTQLIETVACKVNSMSSKVNLAAS
jgi:hypothetical protein